MPKRNPAAEILDRLDRFIEGEQKLPTTLNGKVNVTGLCRLLGLRSSDAQHFHKNDDVKDAVNAVCEEQGILKIGNRTVDQEQAAIEARSERVQRQARSDARAAAEQSGASEYLLARLREVQRELAQVRLERDAALARLAIIENGGVPPWL
ncbi:hypothetical protein [Sphingomonas sp. Ag1]|jgi:hypothetical protein|uniref:hypothetical protein n=1 Tax=Sphingomonas sp. Ag1 TaxID=1642949 RepID=UPI0006219757|nr:hypothetical protein [Sphingomonas sp. Ag1]KKI19596.1 hypothetical protein XM50_08890 [Sphingomonas sp. Ag1]